ncbi:MAG: hypothetical protein GX994_05410, partial [Firmicutes bacterium]|nr:hypothetical protein [Bacillota bacterium]
MGIVSDLVRDIPLPKMIRVKQKFDAAQLNNVIDVLNEQLYQPNIKQLIKPGMSIAVAVGSRGVDRICEITAAVVKMIKKQGGQPFIVPSMGSHGGATAAGQIDVLRQLG